MLIVTRTLAEPLAWADSVPPAGAVVSESTDR
jgi:hypothetical protein